MSDQKHKVSIQLGGIGFYLAFIFSVLKVANVIEAPWWLVLLPLWAPFVVFGLIALFILVVTVLQMYFDKPKF